MANTELKPCLFVEALRPDELIPARFGGHKNYLVAAVGPVQHTAKIYVCCKAASNKYLQSAIYSLLQSCNYARVVFYPEIVCVKRLDKPGVTWKTTGEPIKNR